MVSETTNSYETQSFHTAKNDSIIESVYTAQQTEKKSHQNKSEIAKEEIVEIEDVIIEEIIEVEDVIMKDLDEDVIRCYQ